MALGIGIIVAGIVLMLLANHQTKQAEAQANADADAVAAEVVADQNVGDTSPGTTAQSKTQTGSPVKIEILEAGISIPVAPGVYNAKSQTWTLSTTKAHYALMTPKPNTEGGNTFIYGHNRPSVFSRLTRAKVGDTAVVTTDKNQRFTYRMRSTYTTSPADSSLLNYNGAPILTLQTCTGANFQNRTLYVFDLIGVTNV